ncbi:MAG: hypothetical protein AAGF31_06210 [Planctomycetota bacterium]
MSNRSYRLSESGAPRRSAGGCVLLASAIAIVGCQQDEIRSYTVPPVPSKVADTAPASDAATPAGEPTHRMLGAMIPGERQAWFFKLVAPIDQANQIADSVQQLLESVRLDPETRRPTWELPAGWTDEGPSGIRLTTLKSPPESGGLELTITGLGSAGDWDAAVVSNLNRWRGQMKLPPVDAAAIEENTQPLADATEGAVMVDIRGWFEGGSMSPPFAAGLPRATPAPQAAAVPPAPVRTPAAALSRDIAYKLPDGWVELPPNSMRIANLRTSEDQDAATVTASRFPAVAAMSDVLANVNRWRGQVGLAPIDQTEVDDSKQSIQVDGAEGQLVEMIGDENAILAAMLIRGGQVWFFKLTGTPDAANKQRDAFLTWIDSVRFESANTEEQDP